MQIGKSESEKTEKYIKKVEKYISHEVEEHWVQAWVYCICGWRGLDGIGLDWMGWLS